MFLVVELVSLAVSFCVGSKSKPTSANAAIMHETKQYWLNLSTKVVSETCCSGRCWNRSPIRGDASENRRGRFSRWGEPLVDLRFADDIVKSSQYSIWKGFDNWIVEAAGREHWMLMKGDFVFLTLHNRHR